MPTKPEDLNAPFFTTSEVAWLLGISVKTVYRRVLDGYPCSRRGTGPIKVSREDLQTWYELDRCGAQGIRPKRRRSAVAVAA
jgi:excisionase family DNA binding protein